MFSLSIKSCLKMDNQCTCNIIYLFQLKRNCSHRSPKVLEEWPIHLGSVRGLRKWTLQVLKMWGQTWRIWDAKFRSASTKSTENCDYLVGWWSLRSTPRTQFNSRIKKSLSRFTFHKGPIMKRMSIKTGEEEVLQLWIGFERLHLNCGC